MIMIVIISTCWKVSLVVYILPWQSPGHLKRIEGMKDVADSHEWTPMQNMPNTIYGHAAIRLDTDVAMVCGGATGKKLTEDVFKVTLVSSTSAGWPVFWDSQSVPLWTHVLSIFVYNRHLDANAWFQHAAYIFWHGAVERWLAVDVFAHFYIFDTNAQAHCTCLVVWTWTASETSYWIQSNIWKTTKTGFRARPTTDGSVLL
jgi:hypothetical protein